MWQSLEGSATQPAKQEGVVSFLTLLSIPDPSWSGSKGEDHRRGRTQEPAENSEGPLSHPQPETLNEVSQEIM